MVVEQEWVGLVRCFVSNDTGSKSEEWAACEDKSQPTVTSPDSCTCDKTKDAAVFVDGPTLSAIASLPISAGNAIAWFDGFTPSTTITDIASKTPPASTSNSMIIPAGSPSDSGLQVTTLPSHKTLPRPTIAGIGVGCGMALAMLVTILVLTWVRKRKARKTKNRPALEQIRPRSQIDQAACDISHAEFRDSSWSGYKSELSADVTSISPASPTAPGQQRYQAYNPHLSPLSEVEGSPAAVDETGRNVVHELPG